MSTDMTATPKPPGLTSRKIRTARYVDAFGLLRGIWLSFCEMIGGRHCVSVPQARGRVTIRLGTSDILVWHSVFVREEYGFELPNQPKTIVDAGAYIGMSAIYFSQKYPYAKIYALEPESSNFKLLVGNIKSYPNIVPLRLALSSHTGQEILCDQSTGHWGFSTMPVTHAGAMPGMEVEAISVDGLIERYKLKRIGLLKMDVEGAEKKIFEHSNQWIERVDAIFVELHDRFNPGCTKAFEEATPAFYRTQKDPMTICATRGVSSG